MQTVSPNRQDARERGAIQVEVHATIEIDAMIAVHLPPTAMAVGAQPEIRIFKISKQQKLADMPSR